MHVTPSELRIVRRGPLLLREGLVGDVRCVVFEVPESGTVRTDLEEPCTLAHWGMVLRGGFELRRDAERIDLPAGTAFHVPEGLPAHRFHAQAAGVMVTFAPRVPLGGAFRDGHSPGEGASGETVPGGADAEGRTLIEVASIADLIDVPDLPITVAGAALPLPVRPGSIVAAAALMGPWVFSRVRLGPTSGYTTGWCDLPHWGMVIRGSLTVEWEHDVEVLLAGDVFACPAGPPGHRYEAADGATVIDFTPRGALAGSGRAIPWRPTLADVEAAAKRRRPRAVACR